MPTDIPLLRLLPGHDRRVKAGHPWAFSNEIAMSPEIRASPPGGLVRLEGDDGVRHGMWQFNPHSLIAARRLDRDPEAAIDAAWCRARLAEALALREALFPDSTHYRLVHAEADNLPGLIVDRFGDTLALQANTAGMDRLTPAIVEALVDLLQPRAIVARNDAGTRRLEGLAEESRLLHGTDSTVEVEEGPLRIPVDLLSGQKTGWFFDQRENRDRVARLAPGRRMLDAFCHTGGFGLRAAANGAAHVTLLDRSEPALALAAEAARRNGLQEVATERGEAFAVLERFGGEKRRFDLVVVDPPAFVKSRKDHAAGLKGYGKLIRLAAPLVAPGGFLFAASCSHHVTPGEFAEQIMWGLARAARETRGGQPRNTRVLFQGGAGPDHPLHPMVPESAYLKAVLLQLG